MEKAYAGDLPTAVKAQAQAADELHRKMYPDQYPKEGEAGKPTPDQEGKQPTNPDEVKPKTEEAAKPAEQPKPKEEAKPVEQPAKSAEEDWKGKYETLKGKYDAEVPALHMTIASLQNSVKEMAGRIASLEAAPKKEKEPEKPKEQPAEDPVVKGLKEEYPDIYDAVAKMIQASSPAKPAEVPATDPTKVDSGKKDLNPRATFDFFLEREVPDWKTVNKDPEFIASLAVPDPKNPSITKLQAIQAAYDTGDFASVIGYFKDFKAAKASAAAKPAETPKEKELTPEEKKLAPSTGGHGGGTPPAATPAVTPSDLTKFYNEARQGLWGPLTGEKFRTEERRLLNAITKKT